jgi:hypothetical protein
MSHADEFLERSRQFNARADLADADRYYWYHTVDLGDGLITPGMYDYRETIAAFGFPDDMHGMTVLDVGSATGFFAFEFERRGARVISVELPSLRDLDRFPGQDVERYFPKRLTRRSSSATAIRSATSTGICWRVRSAFAVTVWARVWSAVIPRFTISRWSAPECARVSTWCFLETF